MLKTGEEISKMMNLVLQGIVLNDANKIFIGDLTPEGPSGSARRNVWSSAALLRYTSFTRSIFQVLFSSLADMNSDESAMAVVFVNAIRHSNRVGLFAARIINALVETELRTDPPPQGAAR